MLKRLTIIVLLMGVALGAGAQVKLSVDTLECHVISFGVGALMPGFGSASSGIEGGNMADLYKGPYLNFELSCDYKYKSGWMVTLDADMVFGSNSDNLQQRRERLGDICAPNGYMLDWGGTDGQVMSYNRSLSTRIGIARILPVIKGNPNSGIFLKLSGGWFMQKTVFNQEYYNNPVPQISKDYARMYDHLRNGAILTESVGFLFMSNLSTYVNFRISFDISQCVSWSSRPYQLDNVMGLNGKDNNTYFDLLYGVRLSWMFPLMGKTTYDYYYY